MWWDGTVATNNLILSNNDNEKEIQNSKFESIFIDCFNKEWNDENQLVKKVWDIKNELCSHTKMPILNSIKIVDSIANLNLFKWLKKDDRLKKEQELLYKYIWYSNPLAWFSESFVWADYLFKNNYVYLFKDDKNWTKQENIDRFIKTKDNDDVDRLDLWFTFWIQELYRYEILSPINIIIEDEKWRKIWIDPETGMIINEIPWAWTSGNTEWSNEPEFFIIPKSWTWIINHKIISNPTGNWEYHIVIQDLQKDKNWILQEEEKLIIAWEARLWIDEKYEVNISSEWWSFIKIDSNIEEKYKDLLKKIYFVLDNKYNDKKKEKLKQNLEKVIISWNKENKYTDKVFYLVWKIFNYLNK